MSHKGKKFREFLQHEEACSHARANYGHVVVWCEKHRCWLVGTPKDVYGEIEKAKQVENRKIVLPNSYYVEDNNYDNDLEIEYRNAMKEYYDELADYSDGLGRSHKDGWFYAD
jgi:hypothetical protein